LISFSKDNVILSIEAKKALNKNKH
jgi:hypothetical protein